MKTIGPFQCKVSIHMDQVCQLLAASDILRYVCELSLSRNQVHTLHTWMVTPPVGMFNSGQYSGSFNSGNVLPVAGDL